MTSPTSATRALAIHPATTNPFAARARGAARDRRVGNICPSIDGLEHIDDILADLDQALKAAA
jgi:O-acetylhomoserine/O-acetylserine sulfhydrylase-like pyridoxal-dependent enzyme